MMELQDSRRQDTDKLENEISELNGELAAVEEAAAAQGEALAEVSSNCLSAEVSWGDGCRGWQGFLGVRARFSKRGGGGALMSFMVVVVEP